MRLAALGELAMAGFSTAFHNRWLPVIISDIREFDRGNVAEPYDPAAPLSNSQFVCTLRIEQDNQEVL